MADHQNIRLIRIAGLFGVAASIWMFASDCIVLDTSGSGADLANNGLARITASPNWRLKASGAMAPVGGLLFIIGFAHVYFALKPFGKISAIICASLMAVGYNILAAWHSALLMFAFINRMLPDTQHPNEHESWKYVEFIGFCGFVPIFIGLVFLPILILFRKSLYPRWFCILTPLAFHAITQSTFPMVPAPIGGYLVVGGGSLSLLFFFSLSTVLLWSGGRPVPSTKST